jgi:hypothetical protein
VKNPVRHVQGVAVEKIVELLRDDLIAEFTLSVLLPPHLD